MLKDELYEVQQRLIIEEKQRQDVENELIKLKTNVPVTEHDIEVIFCYVLLHDIFHNNFEICI